MFGGTYLCKYLFSITKRNDSSERPGLTDKHLPSLITVATMRSLKLTLLTHA